MTGDPCSELGKEEEDGRKRRKEGEG